MSSQIVGSTGILILLLCMPSVSTATAIALSWKDIGSRFKRRYSEFSPAKNGMHKAQLKASLATNVRFDPVLSLDQEALVAGSSVKRRISIKQGSPWGSSLEVDFLNGPDAYKMLHEPDHSEEGKALTLTVSQELLKNGPYGAWATDRKALLQRQIDEIEVKKVFERQLFNVLKTFLKIQVLLQHRDASVKALDRVRDQTKDIQDLVSSGVSSSSDSLVAEASEIKASLQVVAYDSQLKDAGEELAVSFFYDNPDQQFVFVRESLPSGLMAQLQKVSWSRDIPDLKLAELEAEVSRQALIIAKRDELPSLKIGSQFTRFSSDDVDRGREISRSIWIRFSMPLISGITRDAVSMAALNLDSSELNLKMVQAELKKEEIRLSRLNDIARKVLDGKKRVSAIKHKILEIEREKYLRGKLSILNLKTILDEVYEADRELIDASEGYLLAKLELAEKVGKLATIFQ